ncbi:MAG: hypothetical protein R8N23_07305 [Reichenbachiella sp.]|uniref:hypothetical protein n=1 Tax=Reichenbachiella sp. TaxID=2184521 RepID=UPI0029661120|nr:hypothetical protein [Reichenbachiella sp.]MDW3209655.1 hypothetical protein [Reichenbachiella sp.]
MEAILKNFKETFPDLNIEARDYNYRWADGSEESGTTYYVTGYSGNPDVQLYFETKEDAQRLFDLTLKGIFIFQDFLAIKSDGVIEVLLIPVSFRSSRIPTENEDESHTHFLEIGMKYFNNDLNIVFEAGQNEDSTLPKFMEFLRGGKRFSRRRVTILKIHGFKKPSVEGQMNDIRNILNSVLFDVEFTYELGFETMNIEGLLRRGIRRRKRGIELPEKKIDLIYKNYIPELIQYFHTAEKVDFLPFKFITYYHIIEYFSDKSAYKIVSDEVKKLMLKPDFHVKTDHYINQAINIFKKENEKHTTDKIKIERVLRQYINREELQSALNEYELIEHFEKDITIQCNKPLTLPAIDFGKEGNFYQNLTKRVYSLRCSIVHSNPDFDETKAIPFIPTPKNIDILRVEMEMIAEIARMIILYSKE